MGLARIYRIRRRRRNSSGELDQPIVFTLVASDTTDGNNTQFAQFDSPEDVRNAPIEQFNSAWGILLTTIGVALADQPAIIASMITDKNDCNYVCDLTTVSVIALTPTSVKLEVDVNSSLLIDGVEFSKDEQVWFRADAGTGNTFTFTNLNPSTQYIFKARERRHPKCNASITQTTPAPQYVTVNYDYLNSDTLRRGDISQLRINGIVYDNPVAAITQQVLTGTNLVISIFPKTNIPTDTGWDNTTILRVSSAGDTDIDSTPSVVGQTAQVAVSFVVSVPNKVYTVKIA